MKPRAILTHLWLDDCFDEGKLVPVLYYHQPITIDQGSKPCDGAVIGISNYSGRERSYIRLVLMFFSQWISNFWAIFWPSYPPILDFNQA